MHQPRKIRPYLWLIAIFCVLGVGHYLFFRFAFHELNPYPITRGVAFGSALWSTALVFAMALRLAWARYVLIVWLSIAFTIFGMTVLLMNKQSIQPLPTPTHEALIAMGMYALALVPLGVSRSLRRHLSPRTAGGA
jgi:hypothetical protein